VLPVPPAIQERVARVLRESGVTVSKDAEAAIAGWIALIASSGERLDLTSAHDDDELVDLMLADALALAPTLHAGARVIDVGSGAGAPGLPLALARPDVEVTLVEPLQRPVALLRAAVGVLPRASLARRWPAPAARRSPAEARTSRWRSPAPRSPRPRGSSWARASPRAGRSGCCSPRSPLPPPARAGRFVAISTIAGP
jgi:hypothetical protein